jgi:hypothetical protein
MTRSRTTVFAGVTAAIATIALVISGAPAAGAKQSSASDKSWHDFISDRTGMLNKLAPSFVDCFKRRDSLIDPLSPIFHGCIDWHSAVHAAYSHHVVYHRTGAYAYLDLVEQQIAPQGVSLVPAELAYERAKGEDLPLSENPYGFGWFLLLARERQISTGKKDFRDMADYAAARLIEWFQTRAARGDAQSFILNAAHPNYSWSLINLDIWGRYTNDDKILDAVHTASKPLFDQSLDKNCPAKSDRSEKAQGFQPPCLMRLAAVAHIWGDHAKDWVQARLPAEGLDIPPVTNPSGCHAGGLNFTRAFALYQLFLVTGDTRYRQNYATLIRYHVGRPKLYRDESYLGDPGYLCYSHWVAQFGVRAISLSYEEPPATPKARRRVADDYRASDATSPP